MNHTPVERYEVKGRTVWVKREDLCGPPEAPPFSKVRGLFRHLERKKAEGVHTVAYVETSVSMAGWGIAWACKSLGMKCIIFDPQKKEPPLIHLFHRKKWLEYGAEVRPIQPGRAVVNYHTVKKSLVSKGVYLMSLGLPLEESIHETEKEFLFTASHQIRPQTVVVCVGSGTICAGIVRALPYYPDMILIGVMSRTGNPNVKKTSIIQKSRTPFFLLPDLPRRFVVEDPGWDYTEPCLISTPFPCHPYYDKKAWDFLVKKVYSFKEPILFWNIGSMKIRRQRKGQNHEEETPLHRYKRDFVEEHR